ncbi:hypothetical protein [Oceanospirillum sediminis]|uniref:DNA repair protein n=1 Tax=Oceanospirillum sediminis TaxID=2760088 RepID=A0A839IJG7_9GAMM|nr:hypothetical protein [Oceanospirillum sediminis]MBB1485315.1 hypothetical protein [Oceanospirillum sediminis]
MTNLIIFGAALCLVLGLIFVVYTKQRNEKKRVEHVKSVRALGDRARNLMFLLDEIPDHYLDQNMRIHLATIITELFQKQYDATPDDKVAKHLQNAKQMLEFAQNNKNVSTVPVTDIQTANNVRRNLKILHKHIQQQYKDKRITHPQAQGYLKQLRKAFTQTIIEVYVSAGKKAEREMKPKIAALNYRRVISEMGKQNQGGEFTDRILATKKRIDELEEEANKMEQRARLEGSSGDPLSQELEKMEQQEDEWKKKQVYD